jgi:hypothetical protein
LAHALVLWGFCGATIGIARHITSLENALIIHAIAVPIITFLISLNYYKKFSYTNPAPTAVIFVSVIIALDAGIVAPFLEKSYAMFTNVLGTWIPFGLIFLSTYITGLFCRGGTGPTPNN